MNSTTVCGIDLDQRDLARMATLIAPVRQPFWGSRALLSATGARARTGAPSKVLCDTYGRWGAAAREPHVLLDELQLADLPKALRARLVRAQVGERDLVPAVRAWREVPGVREQADGHRFVWWPSLVEGRAEAVVRSYVEGEQALPVSRHREVPDAVWARCASVLPGARSLAGTFSLGEDANCFSNVLAAVGDSSAREAWVQREPFEEMLAGRTRRGGRDDDPGTVLVWRSADGLVQHACVTLGGGWALTKRNQAWSSPRLVLSVRQAILDARAPGLRLTRRRLR